MLKRSNRIEYVSVTLPVIASLVEDNAGLQDRFVSMTSGNARIVLSRGNKYDGHVDSYILRWDNFLANTLYANRGRIRVNTADYLDRGFNDVTIAVDLTTLYRTSSYRKGKGQ